MFSQLTLIEDLLKIVLLCGFVSTFLWISSYTQQAKWWKNQIGLTIVVHAIIVALLLVPTTLSLFFNLSRGDSLATAWSDVVIIGSITPVMFWRLMVWRKVARNEPDTAARDEQDKRNTAVRDEQDRRNTAARGEQDKLQGAETSGKLDVIHALVNSAMTSAMQSELDATTRELALMREVVALHRAAGREPTVETLAAIEVTEAKVAELSSSVEDRLRAQADSSAE